MTMQAIATRTNIPFTEGYAIGQSATIARIIGRSTVLASKTLMAKIAASGKWVPLTDVTAVTGAADAVGIYVGDDIAAATVAAADVTGCKIIIGGAPLFFDTAQLVIENSLTLASVISTTVPEFDVTVPEFDVVIPAQADLAVAAPGSGTVTVPSQTVTIAAEEITIAAAVIGACTIADKLAVRGMFAKSIENIFA